MPAHDARTRGLTLIELMVVVAIVGLLAALAIPNYMRFQLRSRTSEAKANLAAIRTAEEGYYAEYGTYVAAAPTPAVVPGAGKASWPLPPPGCPACFETIGWTPDGDVSFQYEVVVATLGLSVGANVYTAAAIADLDGDGVRQIWGYVKPLPDGSSGQPSTLVGGAASAPCAGTGILNGSTGALDLLQTVGPCEATSGRTVF
jgi:type IV pilus assembly protein PilA